MTIFVVKLFHTIIFLLLLACVFHLLYAAAFNRPSRWTLAALILIVVEGIALYINHWRCPLTEWAERLGAEDGSVTQIFLPRWLADRMFVICPPLVGISVLLLVVRMLLSRKPL